MIKPLIPLIFPHGEPNSVHLSQKAILGGVEQHEKILRAILEGDRKQAEEAMASHLQNYLKDITNHS